MSEAARIALYLSRLADFPTTRRPIPFGDQHVLPSESTAPHTCDTRCVGAIPSSLSCTSDRASVPVSLKVGWKPMSYGTDQHHDERRAYKHHVHYRRLRPNLACLHPLGTLLDPIGDLPLQRGRRDSRARALLVSATQKVWRILAAEVGELRHVNRGVLEEAFPSFYYRSPYVHCSRNEWPKVVYLAADWPQTVPVYHGNLLLS